MPTKVLIIDDNESYRRLIAAVLEHYGYAASTASSGEAMARFVEIQPHIVITEIVMTEHEGLQLIVKLRKLRPDLTIVATQGGARAHSYLAVAQLLGANAALEKPFTMDELLGILPLAGSLGTHSTGES